MFKRASTSFLVIIGICGLALGASTLAGRAGPPGTVNVASAATLQPAASGVSHPYQMTLREGLAPLTLRLTALQRTIDRATLAAAVARNAEAAAAAAHPQTTTTAAPVPTATVPTAGGHIPYDFAMWMRVHNCEQPDTWHAGGHFGNGLPSGGDGLGFSLYAVQDAVRYAARRGVVLPSSGWAMDVDQQMQMAQAMLDATGSGPDCLRVVR